MSDENSVNAEMLPMVDDTIEVIKKNVNPKKWKEALDDKYTAAVEAPQPLPVVQSADNKLKVFFRPDQCKGEE